MQKSLCRDEFPRKKSSLIAGKSVEGCFSTEEIILNRRKVCAGMNFHGGNHLNLQESLCRDAFPSENASLHGGIAVPGCFGGWKSIPAKQKQISRCSSGQNGQSNQNNQRSERPERPAQSEQSAARAARAARTTSAIRKFSTASHSINYRNGKRLCQHSSTRH